MIIMKPEDKKRIDDLVTQKTSVADFYRTMLETILQIQSDIHNGASMLSV